METTSNTVTIEVLSKITSRRKISNEKINFLGVKIFSEFYKHFFTELASTFLDVYDSWGKYGTIGVTYRIRIITVLYNKGDKKDIAIVMKYLCV